MAALYEGGPLTQYSAKNAGVIPTEVYGIAINWFVNRTPLSSRLPKLPIGSADFLMTNDNYRPRSQLLDTNALNASQTTIGVIDGSMYDLGDVVQIDSEYMLVTSVSANTVTVTRAYGGTSGANHNANSTVYLITNTRTGAEVDVTSVSRIAAGTTQTCQTVQHAYQVGGSLQADTNYFGGMITPLARDKMLAAQHAMDDFESGMYYGKGVSIAATSSRPMQKGLSTLIATNNTATPTNAAAYKPSDLIRDTVQKCYDGGGNPSILLVSTDFMGGLATWGNAAMRLNAGTNAFGTAVDLFYSPFVGAVNIMPAPLLRPGTAICLSWPEVRVRLKRPMIDKPRGSRGDAEEGDIIMEGAIELDNEAHHAYVTGITAFAAA